MVAVQTRALLNINQTELAALADIGSATVKRIESANEGRLRGAAETLWRIQSALEREGVEFIPGDSSKGPGVRLSKPKLKAPPG